MEIKYTESYEQSLNTFALLRQDFVSYLKSRQHIGSYFCDLSMVFWLFGGRNGKGNKRSGSKTSYFLATFQDKRNCRAEFKMTWTRSPNCDLSVKL